MCLKLPWYWFQPWKDKIPLTCVSEGIWSKSENRKEFDFGQANQATEQAAEQSVLSRSRASRLRSSVIHEHNHFMGKKIC